MFMVHRMTQFRPKNMCVGTSTVVTAASSFVVMNDQCFEALFQTLIPLIKLSKNNFQPLQANFSFILCIGLSPKTYR